MRKTVKAVALAASLLVCAQAWASSNVRGLLDAFSAYGTRPATSAELRQLADQVQAFVSDPANAPALRTDEGRELLARQARLTRYYAAEKALAACAQGSKRALAARILDAAGNARDIVIPCHPRDTQFKTVQDLVGDISKAVDLATGSGRYAAKSKLQDEIHARALKNSFNSYLALAHQYGVGEPSPDALAARFCASERVGRAGVKGGCMPGLEAELRRQGAAYLIELRAGGAAKVTSAEAAEELNRRIAALNRDLKNVRLETRTGVIKDSAHPSPDDRALLEYERRFLEASSSGVGTLLFTEHLRETVGGFRGLDDAKKPAGRSPRFEITPHRTVSAADIEKARDEAMASLRSQIAELNEIQRDKLVSENSRSHYSRDGTYRAPEAARDLDLGKLVRTNPAAVGQLLIAQPEYAGAVCNVLERIDQQDAAKAASDRRWMFGGMIVGGALLATGVGSVAGAWLLAGTASAATLATTATIAAASGTALGLAEAGHHTAEAIEMRREYDGIRTAILAGNTDDQAKVVEVDQALQAYENAKTQAMISAGFSAADLGVLSLAGKAAAKGAKLASRSAGKLESVRGLTRTLDRIAGTPRFTEAVSVARKLVGGRKTARMLEGLSELSEDLRVRVLEKMAVWAKNSPEKLRLTIEEALSLAKNC